MKRCILFLCLLICSIVGKSQGKQDSLWQVWNNSQLQDTVRLQALQDYIKRGYLYKKTDSAYILAEQMDKFAMEVGNRKWMANGKHLLGTIKYSKGDLVGALDYFEQGLLLREEVGDKLGMAKSLNGIAVMNSVLGNPYEAIDAYMKAIRIREQLGDSIGVAKVIGNVGLLYKDQKDYDKSIELFTRGLAIAEKEKDTALISTTLTNLGIIYSTTGQYTRASECFNKSLKLKEQMGDEVELANLLVNLGGHYFHMGMLDSAKIYMERSLELGQKFDNQVSIITNLANLGEIDRVQGRPQEAIRKVEKAHTLAQQLGFKVKMESTSKMLYVLYKEVGRKEEALEMYEMHVSLRDSLKSEENQRELLRQEYKYQYEKEALTDSLQYAQKEAVMQEKSKRQQVGLVATGGGIILLIALAFAIYKGKKRSDELLLNILPSETAKELKQKGYADAKQFNKVTVLFTDFKGFTQISEKLSPRELVAEIDECFKAFDNIIGKYGIEKIKTIGDAYMAAGGLPVPNETNALDVIKAALEMRDWMLEYKKRKGENGFEIRIGVHTGPVVAGIVGIKKFQYDIWGDTVNTASRMESSGEVGKVNISGATYELVKEHFSCKYRGKVAAKGKGDIDMYFVEG